MEEHKILIELEEKFPRIVELPDNIRSIFTFTFSEMFNNAIEHSQSKIIKVEVSVRENNLSFIVEDSGIGAFRNIMKKKKFIVLFFPQPPRTQTMETQKNNKQIAI